MIKYTQWEIIWTNWISYQGESEYKPNKWRKWLFKCCCWKEFISQIWSVKNWHTKSCWCLEWAYKHWWFSNNEYLYKTRCWIKRRINNKKINWYNRYWGRWISIFKEWALDYNVFKKYILDNLWERPLWYSIDRINNDWDYAPWNIKWSSNKEQNRNQSCTILIEYNWETLCALDIRNKYVKEKIWLSWQWFYDRISSWRPHKMAIEYPKTKWKFSFHKEKHNYS